MANRNEARRLWTERRADITEANRRFDEQVDADERERAATHPERVVRETLLAAIPPGAAPSFTAITSAESKGKGRNAAITATLTMFDGRPATVRLEPWAYGWSHQWMSLPGGAISCESGQWVRCPDDEEQAGENMDLFAWAAE